MSNKTKQDDTTFEEYAATKPHLYGNHIEDARGMVPVEYLLNGSRFKLSFQEVECSNCGHSTSEFVCRPLDQYVSELSGEWVALVNAENDKHLKSDRTRCAELEATNRQLNREVISVGDEAEDYAGKLAALEAENKRLTEQLHALSRTVMSDQVSNDSHSLFIAAIRDLAAINEALELDPDDGGAVPIIDAIDELKATIAQQAEQLAAAERRAEIFAYERDFARAQKDVTVKILMGIHNLLNPPVTKVGENTFFFRSPHAAEQIQELSDRIRVIPDELQSIDAAIAAQKGKTNEGQPDRENA